MNHILAHYTRLKQLRDIGSRDTILIKFRNVKVLTTVFYGDGWKM